MYEELIDALRRLSDWSIMDFEDNLSYANQIAKEAADAIEELTAIREEQKAQIIAMAAEIEEQQPRWIPVTERLPEERTEVIAVTTEYDVYICDFIPSVKQFWTIPGDDLHIDDITHWMPLPQPPKEE